MISKDFKTTVAELLGSVGNLMEVSKKFDGFVAFFMSEIFS